MKMVRTARQTMWQMKGVFSLSLSFHQKTDDEIIIYSLGALHFCLLQTNKRRQRDLLRTCGVIIDVKKSKKMKLLALAKNHCRR